MGPIYLLLVLCSAWKEIVVRADSNIIDNPSDATETKPNDSVDPALLAAPRLIEKRVEATPVVDDAKGGVQMPPSTNSQGGGVQDPASFMKINYASKDKGADVLESSEKAKGAGSLVLKDKDKYCITPCEEKLFVVIQLSEDITVEKFVLANYEQYSSTVKDFQVFGSLKYPTLTWKLLGNFTARPGQGDQQFGLRSTVRYLRFDFLTHWGSEYFCTLSQIRVHGTTVLASAHEDLDNHARELEQIHIALTASDDSLKAIMQDIDLDIEAEELSEGDDQESDQEGDGQPPLEVETEVKVEAGGDEEKELDEGDGREEVDPEGRSEVAAAAGTGAVGNEDAAPVVDDSTAAEAATELVSGGGEMGGSSGGGHVSEAYRSDGDDAAAVDDRVAALAMDQDQSSSAGDAGSGGGDKGAALSEESKIEGGVGVVDAAPEAETDKGDVVLGVAQPSAEKEPTLNDESPFEGSPLQVGSADEGGVPMPKVSEEVAATATAQATGDNENRVETNQGDDGVSVSGSGGGGNGDGGSHAGGSGGGVVQKVAVEEKERKGSGAAAISGVAASDSLRLPHLKKERTSIVDETGASGAPTLDGDAPRSGSGGDEGEEEDEGEEGSALSSAVKLTESTSDPAAAAETAAEAARLLGETDVETVVPKEATTLGVAPLDLNADADLQASKTIPPLLPSGREAPPSPPKSPPPVLVGSTAAVVVAAVAVATPVGENDATSHATATPQAVINDDAAAAAEAPTATLVHEKTNASSSSSSSSSLLLDRVGADTTTSESGEVQLVKSSSELTATATIPPHPLSQSSMATALHDLRARLGLNADKKDSRLDGLSKEEKRLGFRELKERVRQELAGEIPRSIDDGDDDEDDDNVEDDRHMGSAAMVTATATAVVGAGLGRTNPPRNVSSTVPREVLSSADKEDGGGGGGGDLVQGVPASAVPPPHSLQFQPTREEGGEERRVGEDIANRESFASEVVAGGGGVRASRGDGVVAVADSGGREGEASTAQKDRPSQPGKNVAAAEAMNAGGGDLSKNAKQPSDKLQVVVEAVVVSGSGVDVDEEEGDASLLGAAANVVAEVAAEVVEKRRQPGDFTPRGGDEAIVGDVKKGDNDASLASPGVAVASSRVESKADSGADVKVSEDVTSSSPPLSTAGDEALASKLTLVQVTHQNESRGGVKKAAVADDGGRNASLHHTSIEQNVAKDAAKSNVSLPLLTAPAGNDGDDAVNKASSTSIAAAALAVPNKWVEPPTKVAAVAKTEATQAESQASEEKGPILTGADSTTAKNTSASAAAAVATAVPAAASSIEAEAASGAAKHESSSFSPNQEVSRQAPPELPGASAASLSAGRGVENSVPPSEANATSKNASAKLAPPLPLPAAAASTVLPNASAGSAATVANHEAAAREPAVDTVVLSGVGAHNQSGASLPNQQPNASTATNATPFILPAAATTTTTAALLLKTNSTAAPPEQSAPATGAAVAVPTRANGTVKIPQAGKAGTVPTDVVSTAAAAPAAAVTAGEAAAAAPVAAAAAAAPAQAVKEKVKEKVKAAAASVDVCLEGLSFARFKEKVQEKVKATVAKQAASSLEQQTSGGAATNDNRIFKTMMDMIKSLEIGTHITELYVVKMHTCYSAVLEDLRTEHKQHAEAQAAATRKAEASAKAVAAELERHTPAGKALAAQMAKLEAWAVKAEARADRMALTAAVAVLSCLLVAAAGLAVALRCRQYSPSPPPPPPLHEEQKQQHSLEEVEEKEAAATDSSSSSGISVVGKADSAGGGGSDGGAGADTPTSFGVAATHLAPTAPPPDNPPAPLQTNARVAAAAGGGAAGGGVSGREGGHLPLPLTPPTRALPVSPLPVVRVDLGKHRSANHTSHGLGDAVADSSSVDVANTEAHLKNEKQENRRGAAGYRSSASKKGGDNNGDAAKSTPPLSSRDTAISPHFSHHLHVGVVGVGL